MNTRTRINLLASAVIVAGGAMLAAAQPAAAATTAFTPCEKFTKTIMAESDQCTKMGGTYSWSGGCGSEGYTIESSCTL